MGNQREIRQLSPRNGLGVVVDIKPNCDNKVAHILGQHDRGYFYTYLVAENAEFSIPNMDGPDMHLSKSTSARLAIQSGGKMWCGYDKFCDHLEFLSKCLNETRFLVADEENYIDEFSIGDGTLVRTRVHSGHGLSIDTYLRKNESVF